jgi:hypothetical protein
MLTKEYKPRGFIQRFTVLSSQANTVDGIQFKRKIYN